MAALHTQCLKDEESDLAPDDRPGNLKFSWANGQPFRKVYDNKNWLGWCDGKLSSKAVSSMDVHFASGADKTRVAALAVPRRI